jgi:membrane associated rhomboid family serine protease
MYEEIPYHFSGPPARRPFAWVTWLIVGSTVAVFLLQLLENHLYGDDVLGNALAFGPQAVAEGHYWTIVTYAWAHAVAMFGDPSLFWLHIVANMVMLGCLGPALEELLGPKRFLGLYLGGVIFSALVWYVFADSGDQQGIIGASGAVFALIAAAGIAAPRVQVMVYVFFVLPIRMTLSVMAIVLCAVEAVQLVVYDFMPGVAHLAHLGGALFGVLYMVALRFLQRR